MGFDEDEESDIQQPVARKSGSPSKEEISKNVGIVEEGDAIFEAPAAKGVTSDKNLAILKEDAEQPIPRKRGRPPKVKKEVAIDEEIGSDIEPPKPKKRGRPPKKSTAALNSQDDSVIDEPQPKKRGRGRPPKNPK